MHALVSGCSAVSDTFLVGVLAQEDSIHSTCCVGSPAHVHCHGQVFSMSRTTGSAVHRWQRGWEIHDIGHIPVAVRALATLSEVLALASGGGISKH